MKLSRIIVAICAAVVLFAGSKRMGVANDYAIPARALMVSKHLENVPFEEVVPGVRAIKTIVSNGVAIIALRIKPDIFRFDLINQLDPEGSRVEEMAKEHDATMAINGGFFRISEKNHKVPVGLLVVNDTQYSSAWKKSGGFLIFRRGRVSILPTAGNAVPTADQIVQSKPVLIEPGGVWAMNTNRPIPKKRTMVCIDREGDLIVMVVIDGGLSLYEAGWLLRDRKDGGFFNCDSAIAMDGGRSTQIWFKDRPDLSFVGGTTVQNAIIIQPR